MGDIAVLPPHVGALHQQQQQQQRSRMLGLMQSTAAAQNAVNPTQFPPPAVPRMPFHSASSTNTARSLFPNTTESSAPNPDSAYYYPRPPVLLARYFFRVFFIRFCLEGILSGLVLLVLWSGEQDCNRVNNESISGRLVWMFHCYV